MFITHLCLARISYRNKDIRYVRSSPKFITVTSIDHKSNSLSIYLNECVQFYPFQLSSLVSDIGGQLGLFVAMSVLTATESLEFCITLLMILFNKQKTKIRGCLPNCCQLVRVLSINTDVLCCSLGKLEMIGWLLYVT